MGMSSDPCEAKTLAKGKHNTDVARRKFIVMPF